MVAVYCTLIFLSFSLINHFSPLLSLWPKPVCLSCNKPGWSMISLLKAICSNYPMHTLADAQAATSPQPQPLLLQVPGGEQRLWEWRETETVNTSFCSCTSEAQGFAGDGARISKLCLSLSDLWSTGVIIPLQPQKNLQQEVLQLLLISISTNYMKQIVSSHVSIIFNSWQWIKVIVFRAKF